MNIVRMISSIFLHHYDNYMHRNDRWEEGRGGFSSEIAAEKRGVGGEERRWEEEEEEERQAGSAHTVGSAVTAAPVQPYTATDQRS